MIDLQEYLKLHIDYPETTVRQYLGEPDDSFAARCFHAAWVYLCKETTHPKLGYQGPAICFRAASWFKREHYRVTDEHVRNEHEAIIAAVRELPGSRRCCCHTTQTD